MTPDEIIKLICDPIGGIDYEIEDPNEDDLLIEETEEDEDDQCDEDEVRY